MSEYLGVITTSPEGDGVLKLIYPAEKVLIVNDSGKLGLYPEGQIDEQGKPRGMQAEALLPFPSYATAVEWLTTK